MIVNKTTPSDGNDSTPQCRVCPHHNTCPGSKFLNMKGVRDYFQRLLVGLKGSQPHELHDMCAIIYHALEMFDSVSYPDSVISDAHNLERFLEQHEHAITTTTTLENDLENLLAKVDAAVRGKLQEMEIFSKKRAEVGDPKPAECLTKLQPNCTNMKEESNN